MLGLPILLNIKSRKKCSETLCFPSKLCIVQLKTWLFLQSFQTVISFPLLFFFLPFMFFFFTHKEIIYPNMKIRQNDNWLFNMLKCIFIRNDNSKLVILWLCRKSGFSLTWLFHLCILSLMSSSNTYIIYCNQRKTLTWTKNQTKNLWIFCIYPFSFLPSLHPNSTFFLPSFFLPSFLLSLIAFLSYFFPFLCL